MQEYQLIDSAVGNNVMGVLALILFVGAYVLDAATGEKKVPAITALIMAAASSIMFYGSAWSVMVQGWIAGALDLVFGLVGVDNPPLSFIFSTAVVITLLVIGFDLKTNPWDNPAALWSLILAPIAVHGSGGVVATVSHHLFGALAFGLIDVFRNLTGL